MSVTVRPLHLGLRAIPLLLAAAGAQANPNDSLQFTASYQIAHEDNLFRLQNKANALALVGRETPEETIKTGTLSARFAKEYGLQKVNLQASAVNYDYQNFSYLGFSALNYNGGANLRLTPRIRLNLASIRQQSINNFGDFRNYSVRSQRTTTYNSAEGLYELDGAYQLRGGVSRNSLVNSATLVEQRDFTINSADVGVQRLFTSGSVLSYRFRKGSGDYTAVTFSSAAFLPSKYDESENEVRFLWAATDKTRIDSRISYLQRSFSQFSFRDYSGVTAGSAVDWSISPRVSLRVGVARDISDFQSLYSNYSESNKLSILPMWRIKEKLALSLRHEITKRRMKGDVPGSSLPRRQDDETLTRVTLDWTPREFISVSTYLQHLSRDSTFTGLGYNSNSVGVLAQVSF